MEKHEIIKLLQGVFDRLGLTWSQAVEDDLEKQDVDFLYKFLMVLNIQTRKWYPRTSK